MNISVLDKIYDVSGLSEHAPRETVIKRDDLVKIIDAIGIKSTLAWINSGDVRDFSK